MRIDRGWSAVGLAVVMVLGLGPSARWIPEADDGGVDVCRNWTEDEYREKWDRYEETAGGGVVHGAYQAARCSYYIAFVGNINGLRSDGKDTGTGVRHPELLPTVLEDVLEPAGLYATWGVSSAVMSDPDQIDFFYDIRGRVNYQEELSLALAEATRSDRVVHTSPEYVEGLRYWGSRPLRLDRYWDAFGDGIWYPHWVKVFDGPVVYGWSVLAPLLRFGDFDPDVLTVLAVDIIEFDREHDGDWAMPGQRIPVLDYADPDAVNGMSAVLAALENNPVAAGQVADRTGDPRILALLDNLAQG